MLWERAVCKFLMKDSIIEVFRRLECRGPHTPLEETFPFSVNCIPWAASAFGPGIKVTIY
jgi:hypothetical protein